MSFVLDITSRNNIYQKYLVKKLEENEIEKDMVLIYDRHSEGDEHYAEFYTIIKINKKTITLNTCKCDGSIVSDENKKIKKEHIRFYYLYLEELPLNEYYCDIHENEVLTGNDDDGWVCAECDEDSKSDSEDDCGCEEAEKIPDNWNYKCPVHYCHGCDGTVGLCCCDGHQDNCDCDKE
jgi:hypothetical protein